MYNISFDIAALFLSIILLIVHGILFDNKSLANRLYQAYMLSTALEAGLDAYTARCIDKVFIHSDSYNLWMNTIYFFVTILAAFLGYRLLSYKYEQVNRHARVASAVVFAFGTSLLIYNLFTGAFFRFQNGEYIKSRYFFLVNLSCVLLLFLILFLIVVHRKSDRQTDVRMPIIFVILIFATFVVQMLIPEALLVAFGEAMTGMGYCLYLDSPEHLKLIDAVDRLKESQMAQLGTLEALDEANEHKTEFLVKMSHELKTPINAILGLNEIILSECDNKDVLQEAERLKKHGDELLELVERVVDFSQLETGKLEIRQTEYEFIDVYMNVIERLEEKCAATDIKFVHALSEHVPKRLYGDTKRCGQIMEELFSLAISDMVGGEICLIVQAKDIVDNAVNLEVVIERRGEVNDAKELSEEQKLAYLIIEEIAECISCELEYDEEDKSRIRIVLPQEIVDLKPVGNIGEAIANFRKKTGADDNRIKFTMPTARVLAVDDMRLNLDVLEGLLMPYRLSVTKAGSGEEAINYMRAGEYDLVFMDIMMPDMDGVETLHRIREDALVVSKDVAVVALTANTFLGAHDKYIADGFADYISKPASRKQLAAALMTYIPEKLEKDWAELEVTEGYEEVKNIDDGREEQKEANVVESIREIEGLDYDKGLEICTGDASLYLEVIREYCKNVVSERLNKAFEEEDWENYKIMIHGLKSSSMSVGLTLLAEQAMELEAAAKEGDINFIRTFHEEWMADYTNIRNRLSAII